MSPSSPSGPVTIELLERYVAGECDPAEQVYMESAFREDPSLETAAAEIRARMVPRGIRGREWGDRAALDAFWRTVRTESSDTTVARRESAVFGHRSKKGIRSERTPRRWVWSAGTIVVAMLMMFLFRARGHDMPGVTHTYSTRADQQGTVTLNDGTQVTLSPNTTLRLVAFGEHTRTVALDRGEAYFDVARSSTTPFVVQTGGATIRVLGTVFLVRNDPSALRTHVAVSEGRVRVNDRWHPDALTTLSAGQAAEVADSNTHVTVGDASAPGTEWLHDGVLFRDTPVSVVLATLGRWYGYKFQCTDSVFVNSSVTIMVSAKSSASALATLEHILGVNLTVVGDTITLTPHPTQRSNGAVPRVQAYDVWTPTREVGR